MDLEEKNAAKNLDFSKESQLTIPETNLLQTYATLLDVLKIMEGNAEIKAEEDLLLGGSPRDNSS